MASMAIGQVAAQSGLTTPTLRYYERLGLIDSPERRNGQRRYDGQVLVRLRLIQMAQDAGFTLAEVGTLIHGFGEDTPPGERWQELAHRKLPVIDAAIQRLLVIRQVLEESLRCDCLTLDACTESGWQQHDATGHMPNE